MNDSIKLYQVDVYWRYGKRYADMHRLGTHEKLERDFVVASNRHRARRWVEDYLMKHWWNRKGEVSGIRDEQGWWTHDRNKVAWLYLDGVRKPDPILAHNADEDGKDRPYGSYTNVYLRYTGDKYAKVQIVRR